MTANCRLNGEFWARNLSAAFQTSYCLKTDFLGTSANANFHLEKGASLGVDTKTVLSEYQNKIYPAMQETFGSPSDIDGSGKIDIVFLDIKDGSTSSSSFVAGFVDPINFQIDQMGSAVRSNQKEVIYIDVKELIELRTKDLSSGRPDIFFATIAHEYQHLIRYQYGLGTDDIWIDEGTSETASDIAGYGAQISRIECFRGAGKANCSGGIAGESLVNWSNSLKNYSYGYAFMNFIYSSSSQSESGRKNFLKNTLKGFSGSRADNMNSMMKIFKYSDNYRADLLGTSEKSMAEKMLGVFLGQSMGYTSFNAILRANQSGSSESWQAAADYYKLPSALSGLHSPSPMPLKTLPSAFIASATQSYRYSGDVTSVSASDSDITAVKSQNEFLLFNGSFSVLSPTKSRSASEPFLHKCYSGELIQQERMESKSYKLLK